jgi:hypothetical protein
MKDQQPGNASHRNRVIAALNELNDALDRRVPHVERAGEIGIAREAMLRKGALTRIDELTGSVSSQQTRDAELADAVMTDDGGPTRKSKR